MGVSVEEELMGGGSSGTTGEGGYVLVMNSVVMKGMFGIWGAEERVCLPQLGGIDGA